MGKHSTFILKKDFEMNNNYNGDDDKKELLTLNCILL